MERIHDELKKLFINDKSYNTNVGLSYTSNKLYRDLEEYEHEVIAYKQTGFLKKKSYLVMDRGIYVDDTFYILVGVRSIEKRGKFYRFQYREDYINYEIDDETGGYLIKMLEVFKKFEQLGDAYAYGQGVEKDIDKALYYYGQTIGMDYMCTKPKYWLSAVGAERYRDKKYLYCYACCLDGLQYQDAYSYYYIGVCLQYGLDIPCDVNKALEYYNKGLEIDPTNPDLCCQSAQALYSLKRYDECFKIIQKSSDKKQCYNLLGILYENGKGCIKNSNKAKDYYLKAVGTGNYHAYFNLALYARCQGDQKQYVQYIKKCQQNGINCYTLLGYGYHFGFGYEKDLDKAIENYNQASRYKQYKYAAYYWLCRLYLEEYEDYEKAYEYAMKCYDDGNINCNSQLSAMYAKGLYVDFDLDKSIELLEEGAKQNDVECLTDLGFINLDGTDSKENEKALEMLKKAVDFERDGLYAFDTYMRCIYNDFKIKTLGELHKHLEVMFMVYERRGAIVEDDFIRLEEYYVSKIAEVYKLKKAYGKIYETVDGEAVCMPLYSGRLYHCMLSLDTLTVYRVLKENVEFDDHGKFASHYKVLLNTDPVEAKVIKKEEIIAEGIKNTMEQMEKDGTMQKILEEEIAKIKAKKNNQ